MKKLLLNIFGWIFLVLGIIGFFTPFLQGILFTLIGLSMLSRTSPWAKRLMVKLREKYPKVAAKSDEWMAKLRWRSGSTPE
ncbi:PGPGW domain-containing protein [Staphylospora marina]|uniref:PGPGW domain-containing protein n=1 Tax=Staphylospora marina TaxID=2490858 RepID=UPI0019D1D496|nr:PGPGW domain-containing protein [Staphylospora marina]